jgi:hypothetical protein
MYHMRVVEDSFAGACSKLSMVMSKLTDGGAGVRGATIFAARFFLAIVVESE